MTPRLKRSLVLAALFILSLILYIDRAAISTAKGPIATELALSDRQMGAVFSAFALGYAAAQIPSGWLADRIGPRRALAIVVVLWSLFTSLTGAMKGLTPLLVVRFLFGVAEAGAFPGSARVFYNWLPAAERGIANGILFSGALLGGAVAFPIGAWLLEHHSWRGTFYMLGIPGVLWAICWMIWFRDYPRENMAHEAADAAGQPPIGSVLGSRGMLLAMFQYFAGNFTFYICISWMHPYLIEHYSLTPSQAARYSMIPLLCGASSNWVAGFVVDSIYKSSWHAWSRRLPGVVGFALATGGVSWVAFADGPTSAIVGFAMATFGVEMTISPSWAFCLDIGGKRSGTVSATMNTAGNLGGFVSTNAFPLLRGLTGSAATYFYVAALLNLVSMLCWVAMKPPARAPMTKSSG